MEQKTVGVYHIRYLQQQLDVVDESSSSRPSLGFPLGIALLLIVIFSLSGIFTCCYHWDKLRNLHRRHHPHLPDNPPPSKITPPSMMLGKQELDAESVTAVIMPGDEIAMFIALPSPCQPYHLPQRLPKSPIPTLISVPLYI